MNSRKSNKELPEYRSPFDDTDGVTEPTEKGVQTSSQDEGDDGSPAKNILGDQQKFRNLLALIALIIYAVVGALVLGYKMQKADSDILPVFGMVYTPLLGIALPRFKLRTENAQGADTS